MRKTMKNIFTIVVGAVLLGLSTASCSKSDNPKGEDEPTFVKRYISAYIVPSSLSIVPTSNDVQINFEGERIERGELYESWADRNNDFYNRKGLFSNAVAVADSLKSVKLITKSDFDAAHPAGSDVSDLANCTYYSLYKYVHNGYKGPEPETISSSCQAVNANTTQLMLPSLRFSFGQKPTTSGTYDFDLVLQFINTELTGKVTYKFE